MITATVELDDVLKLSPEEVHAGVVVLLEISDVNTTAQYAKEIERVRK